MAPLASFTFYDSYERVIIDYSFYDITEAFPIKSIPYNSIYIGVDYKQRGEWLKCWFYHHKTEMTFDICV